MAENLKMLKVTRVLLFFLFVFFVQTNAFAQKVFHENRLYIVKIKLSANKIEPYLADKLETVYEIAQKTQAKVAINAGFFDGKNAKTVSYIFSGGNGCIRDTRTKNSSSRFSDQQLFGCKSIYHDCDRYVVGSGTNSCGRQGV